MTSLQPGRCVRLALDSNVIGEHESIFFHSALNLALIEFVGFATGLLIAIRKP